MDIEKKKKRTASLRYKYEILVIVNYDNSTQLENIHDLDIVRNAESVENIERIMMEKGVRKINGIFRFKFPFL